MNFSDFKQKQKKIRFLNELLEVGLIQNLTLMVLADDFFVIGKESVYLISKISWEVPMWRVNGVFNRSYIKNRLPNDIEYNSYTKVDQSQKDEEYWYVELKIKSKKALRELIREIAWPNDLIDQKKPSIILFEEQ